VGCESAGVSAACGAEGDPAWGVSLVDILECVRGRNLTRWGGVGDCLWLRVFFAVVGVDAAPSVHSMQCRAWTPTPNAKRRHTTELTEHLFRDPAAN
jgi:hypothetical protein